MVEVGDEVKALDLSSSKLEAFPSGLFLLRHISYLNMSGNSLSEVPSAIGALSLLQTLDLRSNFLPLCSIVFLADFCHSIAKTC
jgi:Leucine-rich repeat (LRR) protein